jgi:uncharacterized membrane protein (DUF485 family)
MAVESGPGDIESGKSRADLVNDRRFEQLVQRRNRFAWWLTTCMLAIYFGYILLIAFRRDILASPIAGGVTTLGIPVGLGVILSGIALTGIYVFRANRVYDPELEALRREYDA